MSKTTRLQDPHSIKGPDGCEGWEDMYPYQYRFTTGDPERTAYVRVKPNDAAAIVNQALSGRERFGQPGRTTHRLLTTGNGWTVADVICTCGPHDRGYEEQPTEFAVALVVAGAFQHQAGR